MTRSHVNKLKLMEKLKYGEDYTESLNLFLLAIIVVSVMSGGSGFIVFPLFFFYLAVVQLYSGIALNFLQMEWKQAWERKIVALYTKARQPDLFYLSISICVAVGIVFSFPYILWIRYLLNH